MCNPQFKRPTNLSLSTTSSYLSILQYIVVYIIVSEEGPWQLLELGKQGKRTLALDEMTGSGRVSDLP